MRRFVLLNYEPYLSIAAEEKFLLPFLLGLKNWENQDNLKVSIETLGVEEYIRKNYKFENRDYINSILIRLNEFPKEKKNIVSLENYLTWFKISMDFLTNHLFDNLKIKNIEVFSYIKQLIEPNILFIYKLFRLGYNYLPPCNNLLEIFIDQDITYIDLHVHGETSYNFNDLINFIVKNWNLTADIVLKELLKNKKDRKVFPRYRFQFKNLLAILASYLYIMNAINKEKVYFYHIQTRNDSNAYPSLLKDYSFLFKKFSYLEFLEKLIKIILVNHSNNFDKLIAVSTLLKINELNRDLAFYGTYKGLEYMMEYFNSFLKKAYQKIRYKLKNQKDEVILNTVDLFKRNSENYIEIRLSPDWKQINHWFNQIEKQKNIKFIIHFQKFVLDDFLKGFSNFEKNVFTKIWINPRKKEGVYYIVKNIQKYKDFIIGFDAAAIEYWTPPWIYRVIFKFLKNYFKLYANKKINITFHAGEDFIDTATGLRYIYESIYFLDTKRLGHAMALGVLVDRYHLKYPIVSIPPIMYFFHLLWLNHLMLNYKNLFSNFEITIKNAIKNFFDEFFRKEDYLIKNISALGKDDFFYGLNEVYSSLGFIQILYSKAYAFKDNNIIYRVLYNTFMEIFKDIKTTQYIYFKIIKPIFDGLKRESTKLIEIYPLISKQILDFDQQILLLEKIQKLVISIVKEKNIAIEVCPSSNIILYNISSFKDHPILSNKELVETLAITINTDNPLLLNSNILLEYLLTEQLYGKEILEKSIENSKRFKFSFH